MQGRRPGTVISTDEFITSSNWCGRCLYNIPKGTLLLLLPAATMVLVGIVCLLKDAVHNWQEGIYHVGIIMMSLGGVLCIIICYYCAKSWWENRDKIQYSSRGSDWRGRGSDQEYIVDVEMGVESTAQHDKHSTHL